MNTGALTAFLREIAPVTERLDIMIEAKMKDGALFRLMNDWEHEPGVVPLTQASVEIT